MKHLNLGLAGIILFSVFVTSCKGDPGFHDPDNKTQAEADFGDRWEDIDSFFGDDQIQELKDDYKIVFVPGFLADVPILLEKFSIAEYFSDQIEWLEENDFIEGEHYVRMDRYTEKVTLADYTFEWDSESDTRSNGYILSQEILNTPADKKVIIISHSKGGLDTLAAMINELWVKQSPIWRKAEVWSKVAGWFSIQAPFKGSPIADLVASNKILRGPAYSLLKNWLEGSPRSLIELSSKRRYSYHERNILDIRRMAESVPFVMLSSAAGDSLFDVPAIIAPSFRLMKHAMGFENDGLVPLHNGYMSDVPAAEKILLTDVDHAAPVMSDWLGRYDSDDRVLFLKSILSLMLDRAENRSENAEKN